MQFCLPVNIHWRWDISTFRLLLSCAEILLTNGCLFLKMKFHLLFTKCWKNIARYWVCFTSNNLLLSPRIARLWTSQLWRTRSNFVGTDCRFLISRRPFHFFISLIQSYDTLILKTFPAFSWHYFQKLLFSGSGGCLWSGASFVSKDKGPVWGQERCCCKLWQ